MSTFKAFKIAQQQDGRLLEGIVLRQEDKTVVGFTSTGIFVPDVANEQYETEIEIEIEKEDFWKEVINLYLENLRKDEEMQIKLLNSLDPKIVKGFAESNLRYTLT